MDDDQLTAEQIASLKAKHHSFLLRNKKNLPTISTKIPIATATANAHDVDKTYT